MFNKKNISFPIISDEDELIATIQVEAYPKILQNNKKELLLNNKYFGFTQMDRIVLSTIKTVMKMKLDDIYSRQRKKIMQNEVL